MSDNQSQNVNLSDVPLNDLISEIVNRGYEIEVSALGYHEERKLNLNAKIDTVLDNFCHELRQTVIENSGP